MMAFFQDTLQGNVETALKFYKSAIDVVEWGAERWKDVPFKDKGAIFQPTMARGIKCLRLDTLLEVNLTRPTYSEGAYSRYGIIRLANRTPINTPMKNYLQARTIFSQNLRAPRVRADCILLSTCRSTGILPGKHTRKLQGVLCRTLALIICTVPAAFAFSTRRNNRVKLTAATLQWISPNSTLKRQQNTSRLRQVTRRMTRITLVSREHRLRNGRTCD